MNIKTKSIITLCLTALASMPLSAQSYLGSVFKKEDGTWTRAKNISVGVNNVTVTDYDSNSYTITNSHGSTASVKVIDNVLYCANDESLTSDMVKTASKTGCLTLTGTLNNTNWALLNDGKLNGITSVRFHKVTGDEAFTALSNFKCSTLSSVTFEDCSFPNVTSLEGLYYNSQITSFTFGGMELSSSGLTSLKDMFNTCTNLQSVSLAGMNTSTVTTTENMFSECDSLQNIDWGNITLSSKNCRHMFQTCSSLETIDLSHCNFTGVTDCGYMFSKCSSLTTIDLSKCNLKCGSTLDLKYMFEKCTSLETVNFSGCDLSNATNHKYMFNNCNALKTIKAVGCNEATRTKLQEAKKYYSYLSGVKIVTSESSSTTAE